MQPCISPLQGSNYLRVKIGGIKFLYFIIIIVSYTSAHPWLTSLTSHFICESVGK